MKRASGTPIERSALILSAFMRHDSLTQSALAKAIGLHQPDHLKPWIEWWRDLGCIYICGWLTKNRPLYRLQDEPFLVPDIEYTKPTPAQPCDALPGETALYYLFKGKRMTIREIADNVGMAIGTLRTRLETMSVEAATSKPIRVSRRSS